MWRFGLLDLLLPHHAHYLLERGVPRTLSHAAKRKKKKEREAGKGGGGEGGELLFQLLR